MNSFEVVCIQCPAGKYGQLEKTIIYTFFFIYYILLFILFFLWTAVVGGLKPPDTFLQEQNLGKNQKYFDKKIIFRICTRQSPFFSFSRRAKSII